MSHAVIMRRIADGKWFSGGNGRVTHFASVPRAVKSHSRAVTIIRCDIGEDLSGFEILPASEWPAEKTQEK